MRARPETHSWRCPSPAQAEQTPRRLDATFRSRDDNARWTVENASRVVPSRLPKQPHFVRRPPGDDARRRGVAWPSFERAHTTRAGCRVAAGQQRARLRRSKRRKLALLRRSSAPRRRTRHRLRHTSGQPRPCTGLVVSMQLNGTGMPPSRQARPQGATTTRPRRLNGALTNRRGQNSHTMLCCQWSSHAEQPGDDAPICSAPGQRARGMRRALRGRGDSSARAEMRVARAGRSLSRSRTLRPMVASGHARLLPGPIRCG